MKYLHTMVRVKDIDESLDFYCGKLGLVELKRYESEKGRFTLVFLAAPGDEEAQIELTWNWDPEDYDEAKAEYRKGFDLRYRDTKETLSHRVLISSGFQRCRRSHHMG